MKRTYFSEVCQSRDTIEAYINEVYPNERKRYSYAQQAARYKETLKAEQQERHQLYVATVPFAILIGIVAITIIYFALAGGSR